MKNNTKSPLFGFILLFILLPNNVFAADPDTDGDGIPDSLDSCPTDPETVNGFQDTDGCPDVVPVNDSDGDLIIDSVDSCPTQAETVNGFQDTDGCPDTLPIQDSDKDGISDDYDKCPIQSETINNYQDTDGCPDVVPVSDSVPTKSEQDNSFFQWTAIIAAIITAVGAIGAAKFKKQS